MIIKLNTRNFIVKRPEGNSNDYQGYMRDRAYHQLANIITEEVIKRCLRERTEEDGTIICEVNALLLTEPMEDVNELAYRVERGYPI